MNNPRVLKHVPLASNCFGEKEYAQFIESKENIWKENGYGPWAFIINQKFIGWGGLQPIDNDIEIALILNPNYWGIGKIIFNKIIKSAFEGLKLNSIIILLPPTRKHIRGLLKLGFEKDGKLEINNKLFFRYRLSAFEKN